MTIPSSFIDQILDQSDIVDIVGQRVQLNKKGSTFSNLSGPPKLNSITAFFI